MSGRGRVKVGGASTCVDSSVPYSTIARRERSRKLAQRRRDTYKNIMEDLTGVLPFPSDVVSQLDYNSRLRLAVCFFRLKTMTDTEEDASSYTSASGGEAHYSSSDGGKQIVKKKSVTDKKLVLFHPGTLQDIMSEALDGFIMVIQVDGTVVFLSESVHKHLGIFQSEYIGLTIYDLILEEDHDAVRKKISEAEAKSLTRTTKLGATKIGFFCRMKCSRSKVANTITRSPGYKLVYVSGTLKVSKDEPFIACIVHPVSPPSILELRMEGNMFVTHYAMDMTCLFFDGRLRQLLGYTKEDLVGSTPFNLHHHQDTEATLKCSQGVMARGEGLSGYYRFLNRFGEYVWLQTRATMMHDSRTGQPSYIVCMNFIISKEDGDKDLQLRQAITAGDSKISADSDHAHDPFPLNEREDGVVVDPLQGKGSSADASTAAPLMIKQEEPTSTVEMVTNLDDEGSSSTDCVSPDLGEMSGPDSTPSVTAGVNPDSIPSVNFKDSPDSVPSVTAGVKASPQPHSIDSGNRNHSSSSTSISSSTNSVNQITPPQKTKSDFNHSNCLPDSTTCSISSSSSELASPNKSSDACKMNHTASSSDQGYHSISSNGGGGHVTASISNESELSGASSSCMYRSSPESLKYPLYSPQSVFSSDGSLPPPNGHALSHIDSPESLTSQSKPAQCATTSTVLHHPASDQLSHIDIVTPVTQSVKRVMPPLIPMKQVTPPTHQIQASGSYPPPLIQYSQQVHGDNLGVHVQASHHDQPLGHQLRAEGRRTVIVGNGHGAPQFPQYSYGAVSRNEGENPSNFFPNSNINQVGMAFVKTEPTSPPYYPPPPGPYIISGNPAPQHQGSAAIFTGPHYLEGRGIHHQGVGTQMLTASATGLSSGSYQVQATGSSGVQAGSGMMSDLPQLTGEDLRMLDSFDQVRPPPCGEGRQFYQSLPPAQAQQTSTTLQNYHGNGVVL